VHVFCNPPGNAYGYALHAWFCGALTHACARVRTFAWTHSCARCSHARLTFCRTRASGRLSWWSRHCLRLRTSPAPQATGSRPRLPPACGWQVCVAYMRKRMWQCAQGFWDFRGVLVLSRACPPSMLASRAKRELQAQGVPPARKRWVRKTNPLLSPWLCACLFLRLIDGFGCASAGCVSVGCASAGNASAGCASEGWRLMAVLAGKSS